MMVSFEEAVDELKIRQHNRNGLKVNHISREEFSITLGVLFSFNLIKYYAYNNIAIYSNSLVQMSCLLL